MSPFARVLAELVDAFTPAAPSRAKNTQFAQLVDIDKSTLSHLLAGTTRPSTDLCVRIAVRTETSLTDLLRAAGKLETAELLDSYYTPPDGAPRVRAPRLTRAEQRVLLQWRSLNLRGKLALRIILEWASQRAATPPPSKPDKLY
jgi:transcriptional regulator with XRE-family HTH domain